MRVFHWPGQPCAVQACSVATLGVFDGVHLGHQRILKRVLEGARGMDVPAVVITFDRHPQGVLGSPPEPVVTSLEHKLMLFGEMGLDLCMVIRFTEEVGEMGAADFARTVFRDILHVKELVVGSDWGFGRGREGDAELCKSMSDELGTEVCVVEAVRVDGEIVSSTAIRSAVNEADLPRAAKLLGRPYSLFGMVVEGVGRGRKLGFPTANVDVRDELLPREGVYASRLFARRRLWPSVTSIGAQRTFSDPASVSPMVEVHVLDAKVDLYGRDVEVRLVERLRGQRRFPSAEALSAQIESDVAAARESLARAEEPTVFA